MNLRQPCLLRILAVVVTASLIAGSASPADSPEDSTSTAPAPEIRSWVQVITGNNELQTRLLGAKQLLKVQTPEAEAAVVQILTSNQSDAVIALTQALTDLNGTAPQSLIDPLVALLRSGEAQVRESAINALASFRNEQVAVRVGRVAASRNVEIAARLAAIEVLRRTAGEAQAVDAMVPLATDPDPRIRGPVFTILELISQQTFNNDAEAVRSWWVANRDKPAGERWRRLLQESDASLRRARVDVRSAHTRLVLALTELYDRSSDADRPARLQTYLQDPIPEVRSLASTLIKSMIADRKPVSEPLVAGLSALVDDANVQVRRDALSAIRDLRRGDLAGRLIARWPIETNADVRADLVTTLGRLGNTEAIPFLIDRVTNEPNNALAAGAAESLGRLRGSGESEATLAAAEPLLSLFERIPAIEIESRARVLGAMAAIADPRFLPTFLALLDDDEPALRLAAVRGVAAVGGAPQLGQLMPKMEDPDVSVRSLAVDAIAHGGRDGTHLEALFARTTPSVEPAENIRENAWKGCLRILRDRPINAQLDWAARLDPTTDVSTARRVAELLTPLVTPPVSQQLDSQQLAGAEWKLGSALRKLQRLNDAAVQLRNALDRFDALGDPDARRVGEELAATFLDADRADDAVDLTLSLLKRWSGADWADLTAMLAADLEAKIELGEADRVLLLTTKLIEDSPEPAAVAFQPRFEDIRKEAARLRREQDLETVRMALHDIANLDDPDDPAAQQILVLAERAEAPLVKIMRDAVENGGTNGNDEVELRALEMLKQLRPDWAGYASDARPDEKLAALNAVEATGRIRISPTP